MCRVLILDDDLFYAETIQRLLQDENEAHPDVVTQTEEALEKVSRASARNKPYEILLIDYRLGPGKDGIEVFKELRAISPDSDGIIFTGYDDAESGLLAYEAGAFRYLPKTADNREILFVFRTLRQWRKEQREQSWHKVFSEMLEASIREHEFHAVARVVVHYSLKLGFARAHLFWVPTGRDMNPDGVMLGVRSAGDGCIPNFGSHLFPIGQWVDVATLQKTRRSASLRGAKLGKVSNLMRAGGYQPPVSEAALLPLFSLGQLAGLLMLDYGTVSKFLGEQERSWLDFYARQVSLVLEHAASYSKEKKTTREQVAANRIGQEVTIGATDKTVIEIFEDVRSKLGAHFDTDDFMAVLVDEQNQELDLRLSYQGGQLRHPSRRPLASGLEGWFLEQGEALLIPTDVAGFALKNKIELLGEVPLSWMGVPLQVNGKTIGGLVLSNFQEGQIFIKRDQDLLSLIADQVVGAIQNCWAAEKERQDMERLSVLSRAGFEILQVARENKENLWKPALTLATANYGVGFNRAMLFLLNDATMLVGKAAIGTEDAAQAISDWQNDERRLYTFDDFLSDLCTQNLKSTDFDLLIPTIEIPLEGRQDAFTQVLRTGQFIRLSAQEARSQLPPEVTAKIDLAACAVLPLVVGKEKAAGVVLVDNKHNDNPIVERDLKRLQTVLNYVGLIWETLREREKSENLLNASQEIVSRSGRDDLKDILARICNAALGLSEADWCIIYPFLPNHHKKWTFDIDNTSYAGELKFSLRQVLVKKHPSSNGTTSHILKHGELFVSDVENPGARIGGKRIQSHDFIQAEGVKAIIGMSIQEVLSDDPLGIFYMNFRKPRVFSERDQGYARSFASLAAFAISNARRMDEQEHRRRLGAALQTAEAVNMDMGQEGMLKNVLMQLHHFFRETTLCVLLYDEDEQALKFAPGALEFYKINNPRHRGVRHFPLVGDSIACTVARKTLKSGEIEIANVSNVHEHPGYVGLIVETQSELCASLVSNEHKLLGVLVLERAKISGFERDDEALVRTVARQLSLGLEHFKQRQELTFNRTIAAYNAWASDMAHDINAESANIQGWAYLIQEYAEDNLTIQKYARDIEQSVQKLRLISPRGDQGRLPLLLDESLQRYAEPLCQQKDITLHVVPNAPGVMVEASPQYLQRILRHLIRNAERAMRERKKKKIILRTQVVEEHKVSIQIQDFGPGIPDRIRSLIFQTNVTSKGGGGHGLLITRQLVEEMNGTIRLLPAATRKGAIFLIELPVFKPEEGTSYEPV